MYILKYFTFTFHIIFILSNIILWYWFFQIILLQFIVILSWILNKNRCLISQIEGYFFNQTLMEYLTNRIIHSSSRYIVPWYCRLYMFIIFIVAIIYHIKLEIKALGERLSGFT